MTVTITTFTREKKEEWNAFVSSSNNGTVFHSIDFLDYHPKDRFDFRHLMFYEKDTLVAVLPGALVDSCYRSPTGASFGGFVFQTGIAMQLADAIVKAFVSYLRESGIDQALLTPPMQVYHNTNDEVFEYCMIYNGFSFGNPQYSSVIDLAKVRDKHDMSRNTRHKINKAINKKVRIVQNTGYEAFYPILVGNKAKFGVKPTHTLDELYRIEKLLPGMMTLFLALVGDEPVAGELLFAANPTCVINFYTMHRYECRNYFAVNYLIEHGIKWSVEQGFRYYDYGVSQDTLSDNPLEPSRPLITFKESMAATGCMRKCYVWKA